MTDVERYIHFILAFLAGLQGRWMLWAVFDTDEPTMTITLVLQWYVYVDNLEFWQTRKPLVSNSNRESASKQLGNWQSHLLTSSGDHEQKGTITFDKEIFWIEVFVYAYSVASMTSVSTGVTSTLHICLTITYKAFIIQCVKVVCGLQAGFYCSLGFDLLPFCINTR